MAISKLLPVALIQERNHGDAEANLAIIEQRVAEAARRGARLVLLQELHNGAYFCQHQDVSEFELAEPIPGPSTQRLSQLAKAHGVVLVGSLFERRGAGLYHNTAVVFDADGSIAGKYRKMHIPDDPGFNEKFYFTPGDLGFHPVDTSVGRLGVLVCWDQWYPEGARLTAMQGAEILFYPTAIGWHPSEKRDQGANQHGAWELIQRSHAVANGCYVAAVNRIGLERPEGGDGIEFWGQSFVAGTSGQLLAKAGVDQEEVMIVPVELGQVDSTRTHWPFLRDRRIDAYADLTKRFID